MDALRLERPLERSRSRSDSPWAGLYRLGGIAALLAGLAYVVAIIVEFTAMPDAPTSGGAAVLEFIAAHRSVYILQQILWLAPSVMLVVVFLALYLALKEVDPSLAAVGGVLGIASWAVTLAYPATGGGAPALVYLSDQYAAASSDAQRSAAAAAAEGFLAMNDVPTIMGVLETIGILIFALLMLRSGFHRSIAYLGIATGAIGIVSEALKPVLGIAYIVYGLLVLVWIIAVGWELYRLGSNPADNPRESAR